MSCHNFYYVKRKQKKDPELSASSYENFFLTALNLYSYEMGMILIGPCLGDVFRYIPETMEILFELSGKFHGHLLIL